MIVTSTEFTSYHALLRKKTTTAEPTDRQTVRCHEEDEDKRQDL